MTDTIDVLTAAAQEPSGPALVSPWWPESSRAAISSGTRVSSRCRAIRPTCRRSRGGRSSSSWALHQVPRASLDWHLERYADSTRTSDLNGPDEAVVLTTELTPRSVATAVVEPCGRSWAHSFGAGVEPPLPIASGQAR
jgi:hypothetical protein